jgi:hypothetical protein
MNQAEIYEQREDILSRMLTAQRQVELLKVEMQFLQKMCKHPNSYEYSAMGEKGQACKDCGWQT